MRNTFYIFLFIALFLYINNKQILFAQTATCGAADVVGTLAEWNFETWPPNCPSATPNPSFNPTEPRFEQGLYSFCPNESAACADAVLGSPGHANTSVFANGICLLNFYNPDFAQQSYGGTAFDASSTVFDPDGAANLFIDYVIPAGQESCLSDFSLVVLQKQYDGSTVNFETQGVAVKRNGLLIHTETQTITAGNINATPMNFNFSGDDFCSDGLEEVTFTIVFGLVHRLVPAGDYTSPATTGYDDIKIEGMCGGPAGYATTVRSGCAASGSANNGQIILGNFDPSVHFDFNAGSTYTGGATYATATPLPADNVITNSLPNPTGTQDYTIRVFDPSGCFVDETVTLYERGCPVPCDEPAGMTFVATAATCSGATSDDNGSIQINGVTGGDKVDISSDGTGFDYATANNLAAGSFTFSGLANPIGYQNYTIRIYNGSSCYVDRTITLEENPCGPCSNGVWEIISSDQSDPDSGVNNGNTTEDDYVTFESCKGNGFIDLNLTKTVDVATGNVGTTTFTFTLTLNNAGTIDAEDIQVADLIPRGLYITNAVPSAGIYGQDLGWIIDILGAGQTATLDISVIALQAGIFENCTFVNKAWPSNDPDSVVGNDHTANEDDDDCESITVTGNTPPTITKAFSPENTVTGTPTRLTLKIWNSESTSITLTADLIDNLPNSPAQMTVATDPNIVSSIGGVTAIAGTSSISIATGTVLPPGLSQVHVDVIMPIDGYYCNTIAAGDLATDSGNNVLPTTACVAANSTYCMPPVLNVFLPSIALNSTAELTINIENRNATDMTVQMDANLYFPTGLELAAGTNTGTVSGITFSAGDNVLVIPTGTVLNVGMNTIVVPVLKTSADANDFQIPMNVLIVSACGKDGLGNEDVTVQMRSCLNPTATAAAFEATCNGATANTDAYLQINTATDATHYNFVAGSDYTAGDTDIANATAFDPTTDLPLQFGALPNPSGSQDYTIRVFNETSDCFTDITVTLNEVICEEPCPVTNCIRVTITKK